mmetsp:Transcript_22365/g.38234  ORF Transcript_22365/g.38234 Transcript_22365/m.38234 type:complete len:519 (+) Transcript_22365:2-1558(+)
MLHVTRLLPHASWKPSSASWRPATSWQSWNARSCKQFSVHAHHTHIRVGCGHATSWDEVGAANLQQWILQAGGEIQGIQLHLQRASDGAVTGRQLKADKAILKGQLLASIPKACQLRYDGVQDERLLCLFQKLPVGSDSGTASWQYKQALLLLWHQSLGPASPLLPYISALPGSPGLPSIPVPRVGMLLDDELLEHLQSPGLVNDINNHKYWASWMERELQALTPDQSPFGPHKAINGQTFRAAVAIITSRCFALSSNVHSMPAFIDMADHALESNAEITSDKQTGAVLLHSTRDIAAGHHICITYGPHSNEELLLSFGFILPPGTNQHDRYTWPWDLGVLVELIRQMCGESWISLPLPAWKIAALQRVGLPSEGPEVSLFVGGTGPAPVDGRFLAAVRILLLQPDAETLLATLPSTLLVDWETPIARQHEVFVCKAMAAFLAAVYQSFPTTIQSDRQKLTQLLQDIKESSVDQGPGPSAELDKLSDMRLAVEFRLSVKLALERALILILQRGKDLCP